MTHIIRQQYLHVDVDGAASAGLALQRRLPELCANRLTPAIEQVLERYAPAHGQLTIGCLEIDAGTLPLDRLEHDLAAAVAQALEKSLRAQLPPGAAAAGMVSGNIQHKTIRQSVTEAFVYFLQTGSLPWSFQLPAGRSLEQVILESWQAAPSAAELRALNAAVVSALAPADVQQRLLSQFSPWFLATLLSLIAPAGSKAVDGVLQVLHSCAVPGSAVQYFERYLWQTVFAGVADGKAAASTALELAAEVWQALPAGAVGHSALAAALEQQWPGLTGTVTPAPAIARTTGRLSVRPDTAKPTRPKPGPAEKPPAASHEHPEAQTGIYIDNAGLVLLHPFLPQFFTTLQIAAGDRLVQPERALSLLHFLASGQTGAPEYQLVLAKILCNIPLQTTLAVATLPTAAEQAEALALLNAVIRHWEVLQNTSPDGLRGTFLLRPGKLSRRAAGDWLLQVEANSFDILLDQLPWGMSLIRLPWMETMLWVEWRAV